MPSSPDASGIHGSTAESELLDRIEELSFLRTLNDRLARCPDFSTACQTLVDLVWDDGWADEVTYYSIDEQRRVGRLEACAPPPLECELPCTEIPLRVEPFGQILASDAAVTVLPESLPAPLVDETEERAADEVALAAPMRVRGAVKGVLFVRTRSSSADLDEEQRILAITATSAAFALDVARADAREEFLATLRHDIHNPVSAALGCAQILVQELNRNEPLREFADGVVSSLEVISDLVSNYLHMNAIDQGVPWLRLEDVDLGELTTSVVDRFRANATQKEQQVTVDVEPVSIRADRRQLDRVLANLVSNAIKYTPEHGRIDITVDTDGARARLRVKDNGYGLSDEDLESLFTKYARFHADTDIPGTGLGLFISKALVEAHGGAITVRSEPGRGSEFTVTLPMG